MHIDPQTVGMLIWVLVGATLLAVTCLLICVAIVHAGLPTFRFRRRATSHPSICACDGCRSPF